jgi:hypothetical protein
MRSNFCLKIAPPRLRGILLSGLAFFVVAMQTVGLGVIRVFVPDIRPSAFRTVFALQWLVGGLPIIAFFLAPEYVFRPILSSSNVLTRLDLPITFSQRAAQMQPVNL